MKKTGITIGALLLSCVVFSQVAEQIRIDQVGYYPKGEKIAVLAGTPSGNDFYIISNTTNDTAFLGVLGPLRQSAYSATMTRQINFSAFESSGQYVIAVPGCGRSFPFQINDGVYHGVAVSLLKGYYYMRSNVKLEEKYAGNWKRAAGHPDTAVLVHPSAADDHRAAGTILSTPGGWYDAGDYNKYIVNSGITMGTLFSAYEDFTPYFLTLSSNIPESDNGIPDILDEALYNLRWMLTMQDPADGGVYHKCTNAAFDGMVMPDVTKAPRYVVQKSTPAALDFAAVMAQASRIFKKFEKQTPGLADSCLRAAVAAWKWAEKNPSVVYSQNAINKKFDPDVSTGEYGDRNFTDEKFWAAAELLATTKSKSYYAEVEKGMTQIPSLQSWGNVAMLGYYSMVRNQKTLPEAKMIIDSMKARIVKLADHFMMSKNINVFASVMPSNRNDFVWGSNSVAANQGVMLVNAYFITGNKNYLDGAMSNVHYLLGRNATGYSFITGIGSRSPMHPHHRPSEADGIVEPVPGLLVGGPNPGMQDKCHYPYTEAETAYLDGMCSYASNEIAINWNAPAVYLLNAIEALHKR